MTQSELACLDLIAIPLPIRITIPGTMYEYMHVILYVRRNVPLCGKTPRSEDREETLHGGWTYR